MKKLSTYIAEKLFIKKKTYNYFPETNEELQDIIKELIEERGNEGDFNDIDTSKITDMSQLFKDMNEFNGDISDWDVSNVEDMQWMFYNCKSFNQPLNGWDVSNVTDMRGMFSSCKSFNQDLSNWKISQETKRDDMVFYKCPIKEKYKPKEFRLPKFK